MVKLFGKMVKLFGKNLDKLFFSLLVFAVIKDLFIHLDFYDQNVDDLRRLSSPTANRSPSLMQFVPSTTGFRHNRTLTHVVIPYHEKQIMKLRSNLEVWTEHPPCDPSDNSNNNKPKLVFHVSSSASPLSDFHRRFYVQNFFHQLPDRVKNCFATVYVMTSKISLADDQHVLGARLMFEEFLQGKITNTEGSPSASGYALYMEPDMYPVRRGWLSRIALECAWPQAEFWIKGAVYRGDPQLVEPDEEGLELYRRHARSAGEVHSYIETGRLHINGNAIYNLASADFRHFYFDKLRPYVEARHDGDSLGAYDTDFYEYLHADENYREAREILHYFVYTDTIQNRWKSDWSVRNLTRQFPQTVLVHGGLNVDRRGKLATNPPGITRRSSTEIN